MVKERVHEGILLDETVLYTLTQLSELCVVEEQVLIEMVSYGILEPIGEREVVWQFSGQSLPRIQKALRLHHDLAINWQGISLALELLDEIDVLQETINRLEAQKQSHL